MARRVSLLGSMWIAVIVGGCTLITDVDRSQIGQPTGSAGGTPPDASAPDASSMPEAGTSAGGADAGTPAGGTSAGGADAG